MAKLKKIGKQSKAKKGLKRKRQREIRPQTEQPFEQDSKRRIGLTAEQASHRLCDRRVDNPAGIDTVRVVRAGF